MSFSQTALLVIDLQESFRHRPYWSDRDVPLFLDRLQSLVDGAKARDIPVVQTDRGGQVTYHGPGQAIVYTLVDLRRLGVTVRELVFRIEQSAVQALESFGLAADGLIGEAMFMAASRRKRAGALSRYV